MMARLAGAGEIAGTTGREITPAAIPDRCLAGYWFDELGDEHGNPPREFLDAAPRQANR